MDSEETRLEEINQRSLPSRILGYARLTGPGYLQSAMTLGSGTAAACLLSGWAFGYKLLWVQPVAMLLGVIVFAAIAKQTLNSPERPYDVFWKRLHPLMALAWGVSALFASMFWNIPQYAIAVSSVSDLGTVFGVENADAKSTRWIIGFAILAVCIALSWAYTRRGPMVRLYERLIKITVWGMVLAFGWVAFSTGIQWGELVKGLSGASLFEFVPGYLADPGAESGTLLIILGGFSAAVGINMVFLYPYSLRQRGWGKQHEGLAHYDLISGMFLPFVVASILVIVATANTIGPDAAHHATEKPQSMVHLIPVLSDTMGQNVSAILLGLGLFAMGVSSITVQMVAAGFTATEMFGLKQGGWAHRLCILLPAPVGIWGSVSLKAMGLAIYVSASMLMLLPLAYVGFFILNNMSSYLGAAMPRGKKRWIWNTGLALAIGIVTIACLIQCSDKVRTILAKRAAAKEKKQTAQIEAPRRD